MPKVSIVLPTYNGEMYLKESIDSILSQTFSDWELIIVNDCSTDSTLQIAKEYAARDKRIKVINNKVNQKLPKSLNIGFDNAKGEYLTWTSDDNIYLSKAIEKMVDYLESNTGEYMVCTKMNIISDSRKIIDTSRVYSNKMMMYMNCLGACFLYRSDVIQDIGKYNPDFFLAEDYEYWLRILGYYHNIGYIDEILYLYRWHSQSLSQTRQKEVCYNDAKLKVAYLDKIFSELSDSKDILCAIYYKIHFYYSDDTEITEKFARYIPEILLDTGIDAEKQLVVYGAGKIGKSCAKNNGNQIYCFVDKNEALSGKYINDKEIMSLDKLYELKDNYNIVVAAGFENIYSFLVTLNEMGIKKCSVYKNEF